MATVSIIMPAFNAEEYIQECIDTILAQSYKDWELIIIDDGSTDLTPQIIDCCKDMDSRIIAIHQKNSGVSKARNAGLNVAGGEYIVFVDADDLLPNDSLNIRINIIGDADLAVAGYELFAGDKVIERMPKCTRETWNNRDVVRNIIAPEELGYQGYTVNKLFRKKIIDENGIRFNEEIAFNEDRLFCVTYAICCNNARLTDESVYRYRITQTNATSTVYKMTDVDIKRFMSEFLAFDLVLDSVKNNYPESYYWGAVEAQYRAIVLKRSINRQAKKTRRELNQAIRKYGRIVLGAPHKIISFKKKVKVLGHILLLR